VLLSCASTKQLTYSHKKGCFIFLILVLLCNKNGKGLCGTAT